MISQVKYDHHEIALLKDFIIGYPTDSKVVMVKVDGIDDQSKIKIYEKDREVEVGNEAKDSSTTEDPTGGAPLNKPTLNAATLDVKAPIIKNPNPVSHDSSFRSNPPKMTLYKY